MRNTAPALLSKLSTGVDALWTLLLLSLLLAQRALAWVSHACDIWSVLIACGELAARSAVLNLQAPARRLRPIVARWHKRQLCRCRATSLVLLHGSVFVADCDRYLGKRCVTLAWVLTCSSGRTPEGRVATRARSRCVGSTASRGW